MYWQHRPAEQGRPADAAGGRGELRRRPSTKMQGRRRAAARSGCRRPWPAHLMFCSLIWQNGGEPYAEDGTKAAPSTPTEGVEALTWHGRPDQEGLQPAQRRASTPSTSPSRTARTPCTWDGIWQINDLKVADARLVGIAPIPHDRRAARPSGPTRTTSSSAEQASQDDNKLRRVQGVHQLDQRAVRRVGRVRHDPGPQVGPRERRRSPAHDAGRDRRADRLRQVPAAGARASATSAARPSSMR